MNNHLPYSTRLADTLRLFAVLAILAGLTTPFTAAAGLPKTDIAAEPIDAEAAEPTLKPLPLSPTLTRLLDSLSAGDPFRRELQLFHGQWDGFTALTPNEAAALAWAQRRVKDPMFEVGSVDPRLRAKAAGFLGDTAAVLDLLSEDESLQATFLKARALEDLGRLGDAVTLLTPIRTRLQHETLDDPAELTAGARAIVMLAHLEGRPAQDYRLALRLLARVHQELDPLYWPAHVAEGQLLMTKDNRSEAGAAFEQALALNPAAADAWAGLGRLAVEGYNFDAATEIAQRLRNINPTHPLADELDLRSFLRQRDAASAREPLGPALERFPQRRELLALNAAIQAIAYDDNALDAALERFDALTPTPGNQAAAGSPYALYTAGEALSVARQYASAEDLLRRAVGRSPNWPAPRLELGLLMMQAGDLDAARLELAHAARLDPFHRRVNNQLRLVEQLLGVYQTLETEHFVIRYRPGADEALARDMPGPLEDMHDEITAIFRHHPAEKTQIDLLPDQTTFAVRISGLPRLQALGAATANVIALTPPRAGPEQANPFNWVNVMRHEYAHTINIAQTRGRVPHWFTEACAVSVESTSRSYVNYQRLLADALHNGYLFDYDQVNWGFIRPRTPRDTPLAYAQSHWMLEFITERFGHDAALAMLELYRQGVGDLDTLREVTGYGPDTFMAAFRDWAANQVAVWGLTPVETSDDLAAILTSRGQGVETAELIALLEAHPGEHPDLLRLIAERTLTLPDADAAYRWLHRYAEARPFDPWPHTQFVRLAFDLGEPEAALGSLQFLEKTDNYTADWSLQLAELHRGAGRLDAAQRAIARALHVEPYNAQFRELAATIALQRRDFDTAIYQVEALEILEPDRAVHPTRLAALHHRAGDPAAAHTAAERARALDPDASVTRFLETARSGTNSNDQRDAAGTGSR
ncbi:MAG: tetratricopeptide repeat protein [Planctomycetota bacterium]